jgi:hypothetical protein
MADKDDAVRLEAARAFSQFLLTELTLPGIDVRPSLVRQPSPRFASDSQSRPARPFASSSSNRSVFSAILKR